MGGVGSGKAAGVARSGLAGIGTSGLEWEEEEEDDDDDDEEEEEEDFSGESWSDDARRGEKVGEEIEREASQGEGVDGCDFCDSIS